MQRKFRLLISCLALFVVACGSVPTPEAELAITAQPTPAAGAIGSSAMPPPQTAEATESSTMPPPEAATAGPEDRYSRLREAMVQEGIAGLDIRDEAILEAMRTVPRHEFVPPQYLDQAYDNHPLPIGHGQTISQPYIVALMTQAAQVQAGDRVLEVGTGSGYQAAVAATLAEHVYSVEIIGALADSARERLQRLGYDNVTVQHADGYFGWQDHAPFDAILVTAAPDHIPQPLVQQLKNGGRMVIPVGPVGGYQTLWLLTRDDAGEVHTEDLGAVSFVPLTREE